MDRMIAKAVAFIVRWYLWLKQAVRDGVALGRSDHQDRREAKCGHWATWTRLIPFRGRVRECLYCGKVMGPANETAGVKSE